MAVVTSDFLAGLMTNFRAIFVTEFAAAQAVADYLKLVTRFPSNSDKETYAWLGTVPAMREWLDERVPRGLLASDFSITNKHYEASLEVDRDTLEDDKYGLIGPRIQQLASEAARHPDELVFDFIEANGKAFDDVAFFADTRTIGDSGNIDNLLGMACSGSTAEVLAGIAAAVVAMRRYCDDRGRPMNLVPDCIVCPPDMELLIKNALLPGVAGTARPELAYAGNIISSPHLANTVDWYMFCTARPIRPVFFQDRKAAEFTALDQPTSEEAWKRRRLLYGVDARYAVGWGDPRYGIKLDDT